MTTYIPRKRISEAFITICIASVIIFLLNFLLIKQNILQKKVRFEVGQISDETIVAPFNFYIYQDEKILAERQKRAEQRVLPRYIISSDATFKAQENINEFFKEFENINSQKLSDSEKVNQLLKKGFKISLPSYKILKSRKDRELLYNKLLSGIGTILEKGIIADKPLKDMIIIIDSDKEKEFSIKSFFTKNSAKGYFLDRNDEILKNDKWEILVIELLDIFLNENVLYDEESTQQAIIQARSSVPTITGEVLKNELIVQKHQKITEDIYRKLHALEQAYPPVGGEEKQKGVQKIFSIISQFIYYFFILSLFVIFFYFLHPKMLATFSLFRISIIFTIISAIIIIAVQYFNSLSLYLIPFGMPIILLAFLIDIPAAIIFGLVNFLILIGLTNWDFSTAFIISFSGLSAVLALANPRSRRDFYNATFYMILFFAILTLIFGFIRQPTDKFSTLLTNFGWGIGGSFISLIGSMVLLAPIEQRLPVITNIHLLELGDFSRSLLKTLSEVASGTYHHSIIVGSLAETGAKSIGANSLIARVGSYYHDIGKTKNPEYFIENIKEDPNTHDNLTSVQSAQIVKRHVEDGVKLAKEN
ncbi:MAG: HDIG domain-containing protein, partial [Candidatus Cloacimonetes bacterium]|nr:HDIG domain-containing protein [Candidatus Cloacimonadota bacterium]